MSEHHHHHHGGFWGGIIFGGLIGSFLGLIYAPKTGDETRKKLNDKWNELKESLEGAKTSSEELIAKTRSSIEEGLESITRYVEEKKKKYLGGNGDEERS
jgi:gas vesicle protein